MASGFYRRGILFLFFALLLAGCKPRVPGKYISPREMENILYDYHVADAMFSMRDNYKDTLQMQAFKTAILKKYGHSEAEFDSSMVYYMRHSDRLHDIYDRLSKRLSDNAVAHGSPESSLAHSRTASANGDTTDIWNQEPSAMLVLKAGFNRQSFRVDADTAFHAGDKFVLSFDTKFIYQDGSRNAAALLAVKYANDSIAARYVRMTQDSHYQVEIPDADRLGVKQVSGYFMLNRNMASNTESATTLKLLYLSNMALFRVRTEPAPIANVPDTLSAASDTKVLSDSL